MKESFEKIIERLREVGNLEITVHGGRCNGKTLTLGYVKGIENAIEIVNQVAEECNNDFCEWKIDGVYLHCQHDIELVISCLEEEKYRYKYCPVCSKKIKEVK